MTPAAELVALRAKLKARDGKAGFEENLRQMRARVAELERMLSSG